MKLQSFRRYPLSYYLIGAIVLILMVAVVGLIGISYLATEQTLRTNARSMELQTEDNLVAVFTTKEESLHIYDESLNSRLEEAFPLFLAEYDRAGYDPSHMDLEAVKTAVGGGMELYVIDENATIVATTYAPELGLRFADYAPYFAEYLNRIRLADGFFPDRIVSEKSTGAMKKYAYMPTQDHHYILELGLTVDYPSIVSFRYLDQELIQKVEQSNPYLANVRVFESTLRERINDTSVEINDPALKESLRGVLANRTTLEIADPQAGTTTRYLFVELGNDDYGSDVSRIIELTYTDQPVRDALASSIRYYLSLGLIALIGCALLAFIAIRKLTRPIGRMVDDVNTIAGGDLDHPVTKPFGAELILLEESISTMIVRLKSHIRQSEASEKRFMDLVQLLPQGIFETDLKGKVTFANPAILAEFLLTPEDIQKGACVWDFIIPEDRMMAKERFQNILRGMKTKGTEVTALRKDGSTFPMVIHTAANIKGRTVIGIRGTILDITALKRIEAEIRELNSQLEQRVADRTQQLVEVNRNLESFSYSVSHDLRAPLRAISGYSSILLEDLQDMPEKDKKFLELLRQNAHEMGRLIDDLLNFSKLGQKSLQKETVQPATLVREVLQDLKSDAETNRVEFKVGELPLCQADPVLAKQVFANLLSNAIKFSQTRERPVVEVGSLIKDGQQIFFVRDNGIGFDMRFADKLFGVFQRLHSNEKYEGTGVGLAIVHRIIELHGGRIWVESEL
ncbi:MAG: ATP-binding protein, partial [Methanoregulaceae archaeon]|nr:ATP-binding protein [Methanoregulaceae archaeon]